MEQYDVIRATYYFNNELIKRQGLKTDYEYVQKYDIFNIFDIQDISPYNMCIFRNTYLDTTNVEDRRYKFNHFQFEKDDKGHSIIPYVKDDFQSCYNVCKYLCDDSTDMGKELKDRSKMICDSAIKHGFILDEYEEGLNLVNSNLNSTSEEELG